MEIGSGIAYDSSSGISLTGWGRTLFSNVDRIQDRSVGGKMLYDSEMDDLGLKVDLNAAWSRQSQGTYGHVENFGFSKHGMPANSVANGFSLDAEIAYGLDLWDGFGILAPFNSLDFTSNKESQYRVGIYILLFEGGDFRLEMQVTEFEYLLARGKFNFKGSLEW